MSEAKERFRTIAAVLILLKRENEDGETEYLLQKRQNTGFADGMWGFSASGHVEKGESMTETVCREAKEEIRIDVKPEDVEFMGLFHSVRVDGDPMLLACFRVTKYFGEIKIGEPDKIAELKWFGENELPDDIIGSRKIALDYFRDGVVFYREYSW